MGVIMFVTGAALSLGLHNAQLRSQAHEAFSLTPPFMVGVQIFLCWMLYLYTALALRENVLKVCKHSLVCSQMLQVLQIACCLLFFTALLPKLLSKLRFHVLQLCAIGLSFLGKYITCAC